MSPGPTGIPGDTWQLRPSRMPMPEQEAQRPGPRDKYPDLPSLKVAAAPPTPAHGHSISSGQDSQMGTFSPPRAVPTRSARAPAVPLPATSFRAVQGTLQLPALLQTGAPGGAGSKQPPGTGSFPNTTHSHPMPCSMGQGPQARGRAEDSCQPSAVPKEPITGCGGAPGLVLGTGRAPRRRPCRGAFNVPFSSPRCEQRLH